jgi:hypothetical protein
MMTKPYCCPICNGVCTLPYNFYGCDYPNISTSSVECKTCNGTGLVWSVEQNGKSICSQSFCTEDMINFIMYCDTMTYMDKAIIKRGPAYAFFDKWINDSGIKNKF